MTESELHTLQRNLEQLKLEIDAVLETIIIIGDVLQRIEREKQ